MYAEERQQAIARQVGDRGRMSVAEIAELFDVTTETVRRDLTALEALGVLRRVHGGAVPTSALSTLEPGIVERDAANTEAKAQIARAALDQLPPPGASVLIDAGSTTARFADALPASRAGCAPTPMPPSEPPPSPPWARCASTWPTWARTA